MNRGEKLDDLVAKSDELSLQSKTFYKQVLQYKNRLDYRLLLAFQGLIILVAYLKFSIL